MFAGWTRRYDWRIAVCCRALASTALRCALSHAERLAFRRFSHGRQSHWHGLPGCSCQCPMFQRQCCCWGAGNRPWPVGPGLRGRRMDADGWCVLGVETQERSGRRCSAPEKLCTPAPPPLKGCGWSSGRTGGEHTGDRRIGSRGVPNPGANPHMGGPHLQWPGVR